MSLKNQVKHVYFEGMAIHTYSAANEVMEASNIYFFINPFMGQIQRQLVIRVSQVSKPTNGNQMAQQRDKRERLVTAAKELFHRQGYALTTLADIAKASEVPPGNVYYYFKTKDEIGLAVIGDLAQWFQQKLSGWEQNPDPRQRLLAFLEIPLSMKEILTQRGCPVGGLAQELNNSSFGVKFYTKITPN